MPTGKLSAGRSNTRMVPIDIQGFRNAITTGRTTEDVERPRTVREGIPVSVNTETRGFATRKEVCGQAPSSGWPDTSKRNVPLMPVLCEEKSAAEGLSRWKSLRS